MSISSSSTHLISALRAFRCTHTPFGFFQLERCTINRGTSHQTSSSPVFKRFIKMAPQAQAGEPITINGRKYRAIKEGLASILAPYREDKPDEARTQNPKHQPKNRPHNNDEGDQAVFYNPIQQYNRDLSVLAILTYGEGAVVEKREKWEKKFHGREKWRKSKIAAQQNAGAANGSVGQSDVSKKRKADEIEEDGNGALNDGGVKRVKSDDVLEDEDEDEDLEVSLLVGDPEKGNATSGSTTVPQKTGSDTIPGNESTAKKSKGPPFAILDALSASGLRAIRYAKEIPFATKIVANDLSAEAVKSISLNIEHNDVTSTVHSNVGDARAYMYSKVGNESQHPSDSYVHRFDVIDLDPYGTAAPFFDSALQALTDGGLLAVTCTDAGVFASNGYPEKAYALYDGVPMKGVFNHEAGLRLILHAIATSAAKYGIAIEPLLSLSIDFYARLFIRVHKSPAQVKLLAGTTMITYSCDYGCGAWNTQLLARNQSKKDKVGGEFYKHSFSQAPSSSPHCSHCNSRMHLGGPMWAGLLHNPYFVQRILDKLPTLDTNTYGTTERIRGMLTVALEEDLTLASSNTEATQDSESSINQNLSKQATTSKKDIPVNPAIIPALPPSTIDSTPFFFIPNYLAKVLHCSTPPENALRGAIRSLGYHVTRSHCKPGSFKTNAPWPTLWEVMREWIRQKAPVKEGAVKPNTPGWQIMQKSRTSPAKIVHDIGDELKRALDRGNVSVDDFKTLLQSGLYQLDHPPKMSPTAEPIDTEEKKEEDERAHDLRPTTTSSQQDDTAAQARGTSNPAPEPSRLKVNFDARLGRERSREKLVRYQINPRANWGPMNRAGN